MEGSRLRFSPQLAIQRRVQILVAALQSGSKMLKPASSQSVLSSLERDPTPHHKLTGLHLNLHLLIPRVVRPP